MVGKNVDDAKTLLTAAGFVSLGIFLFHQVGLLTGGTAGLAFLIHYATGITFGKAFFVLNLPFYWLALRKMGWAFTLKTFIAVALLSVLTDNTVEVIQAQDNRVPMPAKPDFIVMTLIGRARLATAIVSTNGLSARDTMVPTAFTVRNSGEPTARLPEPISLRISGSAVISPSAI